MPKVYITLDERRQAEINKQHRKQDLMLTGELRQAAKNQKYSYDAIAHKAGVGKSTVQKAFNEPSCMRIDYLRKICFALGIDLEITGTTQECKV